MSRSQPVAEPPAATASPPTGRETALVAVGQGALMVLGGVLALLVAQRFGKNTETDAFFAAYGIYAVGLTFAGTFRLTGVARLVQSNRSEPVTLLLGAVALIALLVGIPMLALADPLGRLLIESDPTGVAPTALRILWIALAGQLLAAMLSAVLAARGAFTAIGVATLAAGFISVGTFLLLAPAAGVPAAAIGLAASAVWLTGAFGISLRRTGWRPTALTTRALRAMGIEAARLAFASAIFIGSNVSYVVCLALSAREGEGEATLFSYAFVLAVMLIGVTANVSATMRAPSLVSGPDRADRVAVAGVESFRFTVVLIGPVLAMAILAGGPVLGVALGSGFSDDDVQRILVTLVCLVGWILASAATIFATVELLAQDALVRLAVLAAVQVAAVAAAAGLGAALGGIEAIAAALSAVVLAAAVVQLRWAFGSAWHRGAAAMARAAARELIVLVAAFAPSALLIVLLGDATAVVAAAGVLAAALVVVATSVAWPDEHRALVGLLRRPGTAP